jgi:hypothetical protein
VLIGERLCESCEAPKSSEGDLQEASGISRFHTSRIEKGHAIQDIPTLRQCARALEVLLSVLIYGSDAPTNAEDLALLRSIFLLSSFVNLGEV